MKPLFDNIEPAGSDAPIIANERGGKQSQIHGTPTEIPPLAFIEVAKVMGLGASRYPREADGTPNWHRISCLSNLDHGLEHIFNFLAERNHPDSSPEIMLEELSHAAARLCMALEQYLRGDFK